MELQSKTVAALWFSCCSSWKTFVIQLKHSYARIKEAMKGGSISRASVKIPTWYVWRIAPPFPHTSTKSLDLRGNITAICTWSCSLELCVVGCSCFFSRAERWLCSRSASRQCKTTPVLWSNPLQGTCLTTGWYWKLNFSAWYRLASTIWTQMLWSEIWKKLYQTSEKLRPAWPVSPAPNQNILSLTARIQAVLKWVRLCCYWKQSVSVGFWRILTFPMLVRLHSYKSTQPFGSSCKTTRKWCRQVTMLIWRTCKHRSM